MKLGFDRKDPSTARGIIGIAVAIMGGYLIMTGAAGDDPIDSLLLLGIGLQGFFGAATTGPTK